MGICCDVWVCESDWKAKQKGINEVIDNLENKYQNSTNNNLPIS